MRSVELFAGAGGLALGTALAGFDAVAAVEWNRWACDTLETNRDNGFPLLRGVQIGRGDARDFPYAEITEPIDLISGGPPCQPFSAGGKGKGFNDERDMFNAFAEAVAVLTPRAFIIENVKGLLRPAFADYIDYIEHRVSAPQLRPSTGQIWPDHLAILKTAQRVGINRGVTYTVSRRLYNAADMGVPQKRERVFFVGIRSDVDADWAFPEPTHSYDALLRDQWITGDYWTRHGVDPQDRPVISEAAARCVEVLRKTGKGADLLPWRTVRDALADLPEPPVDGSETGIPNHRFQGGARVYPGHTGSPIDLPAKALKAGAHGVPGGENMLVRVDGSVRYFTVREAARLQTFPDDYVFCGAWGEAMRQLGNAVPVELARAIAESVSVALVHTDC